MLHMHKIFPMGVHTVCFLIAGDKAGSKKSKAEDLGVTILDEEGFQGLLENS